MACGQHRWGKCVMNSRMGCSRNHRSLACRSLPIIWLPKDVHMPPGVLSQSSPELMWEDNVD